MDRGAPSWALGSPVRCQAPAPAPGRLRPGSRLLCLQVFWLPWAQHLCCCQKAGDGDVIQGTGSCLHVCPSCLPAHQLSPVGTRGQEGLQSLPVQVLLLQRALRQGRMVADTLQGGERSTERACVPIPVPNLSRGRRFTLVVNGRGSGVSPAAGARVLTGPGGESATDYW